MPNTVSRIAVLGSTGSIGRQVLDVAERLNGRVQIVALAADRNWQELAAQAQKWGVKQVALFQPDAAAHARSALSPLGITVHEGMQGLSALATLLEVDTVVMSVAGMVGFEPTLAAIEAGKTIALASKEVLVAGGDLVDEALKRRRVPMLPIDSEHSAIFQCLQGAQPESVEKILLTASGGPFRQKSAAEIENATAAEALNHPTWNMGALVTVNSASLMNKGLEVLEAKWLFGTPVERIQVVVHPQSIVHSMVQFNDGSVLAQMGLPDMRLPIQYSLVYPERIDTALPRMDLAQLGGLTFEAPDLTRFPCLALAFEAARIGKTMPAAMNGANEAAVAQFLQGKIRFGEIPRLIEQVMNKHEAQDVTLEGVLETDRWAREFAARLAGAEVETASN